LWCEAIAIGGGGGKPYAALFLIRKPGE